MKDVKRMNSPNSVSIMTVEAMCSAVFSFLTFRLLFCQEARRQQTHCLGNTSLKRFLVVNDPHSSGLFKQFIRQPGDKLY